jgi:hypothetical protein
VLVIFKKNGRYLEKVVNGGAQINDPILTRLDNIATLTFGVGVLLSVIIGISAAVDSYSTKVSEMTKKHIVDGIGMDSFSGAARLQQQRSELQNSFSGAPKMQQQNKKTEAQGNSATVARQANTEIPPPPATSADGSKK